MEIKIEVCDFLIFISDLRMDFLVSNMLAYFEKLSEKFPDTNEEISKEIEDNASQTLGEMLKTSIEEIDEKFRSEPEGNNLLGAVVDLKFFG